MQWRKRPSGLWTPKDRLCSFIRGVAGGGSQWTPADLTNPVCWLNPTRGITTVTSNVSSWIDRIAGLDFVQATDGDRPGFVSAGFNGIDCIEGFHDASGQENLKVSSVAHSIGTGNFYFAAVINADTLSAANSIIFSNASSDSLAFQASSTASAGRPRLAIGQGGGRVNSDFASHTLSTATAYVIEFWREGTSVRCRVNGKFDSDGNTNSASAGTTTDLMVAFNSFGGAFDGKMAEFVLAQSFNINEANKTLKYLANRWGVTLWNPNSISGLVAWFDASDASTITQSGGRVSNWANKVTGNDFAQATGSIQPLLALREQNGLDALFFDDGRSDNMVCSTYAAIELTDDLTVFMIYKGDSGATTAFRNLIRKIGSAEGWEFNRHGTSSELQWRIDTDGGFNQTVDPRFGDFLDDAAHLFVWEFNTGTGVGRESQTQYVSGTYTHGSGFTTTPNLEVHGVHGWVCEIGIFNKLLSTAERDILEDHLEAKWGTE